MKTTVFMLLNALPAWLSLPRGERRAFHAEVLAPILAAHPATRMRYYDAEAFTGRCSDIAAFETENLQDYSDLIEALRDTPFFGAARLRGGGGRHHLWRSKNGYLDYVSSALDRLRRHRAEFGLPIPLDEAMQIPAPHCENGAHNNGIR